MVCGTFKPDKLKERYTCHMAYCPVDGVWQEWRPWTNCTSLCGRATRSRSRSCYDPLFDGKPCDPPDKQIEECELEPCAGM